MPIDIPVNPYTPFQFLQDGLAFHELTPKGGGTMNAGCSVNEGGRSTIKYLVQREINEANTDPTLQQFQLANIWSNILGRVDLNNGRPIPSPTSPTGFSGGIARQLPLAHPLFPYWYATDVNNLVGLGKYTKQNPVTIPGMTDVLQSMPNYAQYEAYLVEIEFKPLKYALIDDLTTGFGSFTWYYFNGDAKKYVFSREWLRYSYFEMQQQYNNVTLPSGSLMFSDYPAVGGGPASINRTPFQASITMYLPDTEMMFYWHQVPYRFYTSPRSYLRRFVGMINQFSWNPAGFLDEDNAFLAGQLQYLGAKPKIYTPPVPAPDAVINGVFSTEKLCDMELRFMLTNRTCSTVPTTQTPNIRLPNGQLIGAADLYGANGQVNFNYVTAGHNLFPSHRTRQFHYARTNPAANFAYSYPNAPAWFSFPVELLFTDPDAPQPANAGEPTVQGSNGLTYPQWQSTLFRP